MQTIKTKEIDSFKIIIGFDQLSVDTAASMINASEKIKELPEYKELEKKSKEKEEHARKSAQAKGKAKLALVGKTDADKDKQTGLSKKLYQEYLKQDKEYRDRLGAAGVCNTELVEINTRLEPLAKEVRRSNLIYSDPRLDEIVDSPELVSELMANFIALKDNEKLGLEIDEKGCIIPDSVSVVSDFRDCQYFYKDKEGAWNEEPIITALGVTKNTVVVDDYQDSAVERGDLKPEQSEEIRFQGLSDDEKLSEFTQKKIVLASQAASMENSLKFDGDVDFQTKAQAWYDAELAELKTLYGVEK